MNSDRVAVAFVLLSIGLGGQPVAAQTSGTWTPDVRRADDT